MDSLFLREIGPAKVGERRKAAAERTKGMLFMLSSRLGNLKDCSTSAGIL